MDKVLTHTILENAGVPMAKWDFVTMRDMDNFDAVAEKMEANKPDAVYITSPDYLGNVADIEGLAKVCRRFGVPLMVDNAHGAYLKFLP